jgi:hypothetical protein
MSLKTLPVYDHPAYQVRLNGFNSIMTAGSAGVSGKFVAFANMLLFSLNTYTTIAGTSTYTGGLVGGPLGVNPTTGVAVAATQLSLIRITNTASAGATIALSTSTVGPFTVGGVFLGAGGTATNQVGAYNQFALNTAAGSANFGGLPINQGDQIYVVNGTDATAVELVSFDYQVQPLAAVTA